MPRRLPLALALLLATPLFALSAAPPDPARCGGDPSGRVSVAYAGGVLSYEVRPTGAIAAATVRFATPLATAGAERLQLEGRAVEDSGLGLCISRVQALDETGKPVASYEPDLWFNPEWNLRTILVRDFDQPLPARLGGVYLSFWSPRDAGKRYTVALRRAELWTPADVAKAVTPNATPRPPVPMRAAQPAAGARWHSFGPGGGGWYRVMAISPHDGTLFVGADVGGIYRSRDLGRTWEMVNTGIPQLYVNCLAFHPVDPKVVFAGCNGGVLKSTDGGTSWAVKRRGFPPLMTFGQSAPIASLAVDPAAPNGVYAGVGHERDYGRLNSETVGGRVYRSDDGGESWTGVSLPGETKRLSVLSLVLHPTRPRDVYATTQAGLFRSTDGGRTWERWGQGLEPYQLTFLALRRDRPETLLLAYHDGPAKHGGVLRSTDGGRTWSEVNTGLPAAPDAWRLVADPQDPARFLVGWHRRAGIYATDDGGDTWHALTDSPIRSAWFFIGENATGLAVDPRDPKRIVFCNDMDMYQTQDGGASWEQICCDLIKPATETTPNVWRGRGCEVLCASGPQALAVDPGRPESLIFGYWDTCAWKSDDGGATCYRLTDGIHAGYGRMGAVVYDPADADSVWLTIGENYTQQRVYHSVDGARRFHLLGYDATGLPPSGIFSLVVDPSSPRERRTLYAALTGSGVYRSDDGGLSWQAKVTGLPADSLFAQQVALDPRDPRRVWLVAGAHYHPETKQRVPGYIARSDDRGEHWTVLKDHIEPQCLAIDQFDSNHVLVGNRDFSGLDLPNALYVTTDGGRTWRSLPHDPFLAGPGSRGGDQGERVNVVGLVADPSTRGTFYAACSEYSYDVGNGRGVFSSTDGGLTWRPFTRDGLAQYGIGTLVIDPTNPARLFAGTGGNGFFRFGP